MLCDTCISWCQWTDAKGLSRDGGIGYPRNWLWCHPLHSVIYGTCSKSGLGSRLKVPDRIYEELYVLTKNSTALEVGEGAYHLVSKGTCAVQGLKEIKETKQILESFPQLLSSDSFFVPVNPKGITEQGSLAWPLCSFYPGF